MYYTFFYLNHFSFFVHRNMNCPKGVYCLPSIIYGRTSPAYLSPETIGSCPFSFLRPGPDSGWISTCSCFLNNTETAFFSLSRPSYTAFKQTHIYTAAIIMWPYNFLKL